jgi:glutathionyl-hydroquinone reductase
LKSENSKRGKWTEVYDVINQYDIFEDHAVITALKSVPHFYELYVQHFVCKQKELPHFRNLLSSFCAAWIQRLYLQEEEKKE